MPNHISKIRNVLKDRLGYLIEIGQMRPRNCPNFQKFSENRKCALFFSKIFPKIAKNPQKICAKSQNREMRLSASKKCALYGERVPQSNQVC